jgi:hypothetical protein
VRVHERYWRANVLSAGRSIALIDVHNQPEERTIQRALNERRSGGRSSAQTHRRGRPFNHPFVRTPHVRSNKQTHRREHTSVRTYEQCTSGPPHKQTNRLTMNDAQCPGVRSSNRRSPRRSAEQTQRCGRTYPRRSNTQMPRCSTATRPCVQPNKLIDVNARSS